MGIELTNAGETLAAIVVSDEINTSEINHTKRDKPANPHEDTDAVCANCGTSLTGAYCHTCGQSAHIHRSLLHMFEEVLHGIFHFDTKAWRTIPALIKRPGQLTKDYIQGKRTSFVSPLALFLFLIFLMFFVFSLTMKDPSNAILNIPETRETVVKELAASQTKLAEEQTKLNALPANSSATGELRLSIRDMQMKIRQLQDSLDAIDGKEFDSKAAQQQLAEAEKNLAQFRVLEAQLEQASAHAASSANTTNNTTTIKPWDLREEIRFAEKEVEHYKKRIAKANQANAASASAENSGKIGFSATTDSTISTETNKAANRKSAQDQADSGDETRNLADIPYIGKALAHAEKNRELTLYKMKKNAASLAFLLMPISLPFLWLLFAFKRQYVMFDHAVFSLYSLSFMCLLLMLIATLARFDFAGTAGFLFLTVPPLHMFLQLRQAYDLGVLSTLWRTIALLFIALLSLAIYAAVVTLLSA